MCFVEVAGVSTRLSTFFSTCASQCTASHSQACHYGCRDLAGGAYLLSKLPWDYLLHPGIRFGRVVMCFVEVAGVTTRLSPYTPAQPLTLTHATPSPVLSRSCASIAEVFLDLLHLGFHFGGVVMRFVEVAGVSTRLTAFFSTCAS